MVKGSISLSSAIWGCRFFGFRIQGRGPLACFIEPCSLISRCSGQCMKEEIELMLSGLNLAYAANSSVVRIADV